MFAIFELLAWFIDVLRSRKHFRSLDEFRIRQEALRRAVERSKADRAPGVTMTELGLLRDQAIAKGMRPRLIAEILDEMKAGRDA